MRNISKYPVTTTEKMLFIEDLIEREEAKLMSPDAPVGGISLLILRDIKENIEFASDEYNRRTIREKALDSSSRNMAAQMEGGFTPR